MNKMMQRMSPYKAVITPLVMWDDQEVVEKVTRLREEGKLIYERNAAMNQRGVPRGPRRRRRNESERRSAVWEEAQDETSDKAARHARRGETRELDVRWRR